MAKGKGGGSQTTTQKLDPLIQQQIGRQFAATNDAYANYNYTPYGGQRVAGADPAAAAAGSAFGAVSPLAAQGAAALGGDQGAMGKFFNPFQSQVIGQLGSQYDRMRSQAALGANDAATQAGAFGGDRHALLVGEREGALDRQQGQDTANLLYQGFGDAQQRAAQAANLGLGAAGQQLGYGDYNRGIQQQGLDTAYQDFLNKQNFPIQKLGILQSGWNGIPGGAGTTTQPLSQNRGASIAGGAAAGGAIGGPIGAGIGGGLGLLGFL
jgi:hypothetical protein